MAAFQTPTKMLRRLMIFIDGENLTFRYQEMVGLGRIPFSDTNHLKDVYVWNNRVVIPANNVVIRATYYTYVQGDEEKVRTTHDEIREFEFKQYFPCGLGNKLYSKVFKKPKHTKAKGVDIQMSLDILSNVYQDNTDAIYLLSGDGDYRPVIEECVRLGKTVYLGAFSHGFNRDLQIHTDKNYLLDECFFDASQSSEGSDQAGLSS